MADAREVVTAALKELGVLASGETATAGDADDGLSALNRLVDQWAAERLQIFTTTRTLATLTANQESFTVGTGGNIAIVRPVYLENVGFVDTAPNPDQEYPLDRLTEDDWAGIRQKARTSVYPQAYYYNPTFTSSQGTLYPWPIPTSGTLQWAVYHPTAVTEFASLSTTVSLPPGYRRMLVKNLALELAPSYERDVSGLLARQAMDAISVVKRANFRMADLQFEAGALATDNRRAWNIREGP